MLAGAVFATCRAKPPAPPVEAGSLCLGRYVGFGQNTSSLWCRQDSCFSARHARNEVAAAPVGFYSGAMEPGSYRRARELAFKVLAKKDWKMMAGAPSVRIVLDDTLERTVSWHPANADALEGLDDWKEAVMDSLQSHPLWKDSLALQTGPGKGYLSLFLASGKSGEAWLGKGPEIELLFGTHGAGFDSQATADGECVRNLISGGKCTQAIPKGMRWAKAIVRASPRDATLGAGKACLDGRFELVTEQIPIP